MIFFPYCSIFFLNLTSTLSFLKPLYYNLNVKVFLYLFSFHFITLTKKKKNRGKKILKLIKRLFKILMFNLLDKTKRKKMTKLVLIFIALFIIGTNIN